MMDKWGKADFQGSVSGVLAISLPLSVQFANASASTPVSVSMFASPASDVNKLRQPVDG